MLRRRRRQGIACAAGLLLPSRVGGPHGEPVNTPAETTMIALPRTSTRHPQRQPHPHHPPTQHHTRRPAPPTPENRRPNTQPSPHPFCGAAEHSTPHPQPRRIHDLGPLRRPLARGRIVARITRQPSELFFVGSNPTGPAPFPAPAELARSLGRAKIVRELGSTGPGLLGPVKRRNAARSQRFGCNLERLTFQRMFHG